MSMGFDNVNEYPMKLIRFKEKKRFISLWLVLLLLVSPFATVGVGATTATSFANDETIEVTERVNVWERSILPLRTDTSDAATKIPNAEWKLSVDDSPQVPLNKDSLGVFTAGTEITVHFDSDDAGPKLKGNVHLIAARLDPSVEKPMTLSEAMTLLDTADRSDLNKHVTFHDAGTATLSDGSATLSFEPKKSGPYILFLALGESEKAGLTVTDSHDLSVTEQTTIVGLDYALVQDKASRVTLEDSNPKRGQKLTFDIKDSLDGDNVQHAILVYDENTGFDDQVFEIHVADEPSTLTELSDSTTLYSSIKHIRGVLRVEADTTVLGRDFSDKHVGVSPSVGTVADFMATKMTRDVPTVKYKDELAKGGLYLDASLTVVSGRQDKITVKTLKNWTAPETYRWVHIAVNENGEIRTSTDSFDLQQQTSDGGGGDDGDDGDGDTPPADGGDDDTPPASGGGGGGSLEPPAPRVEQKQQADGSVLTDIRNGRSGSTINVNIPSKQATRVSGVAFEGIDVELAKDNSHFTLAINTFATRPSTVPSDPNGVAVKGYLQVKKQYITNADIKQATIHFQVSPEQLSEHSTPENIVLYRYHDGSWQTLETTFVGKQNGQYAFKAVIPGFSVFAIGEQQPSISVTGADLERSSITLGETVQVTAEVTNDGNGEGIYTVELTVEGEVVKKKQVTVGAGETKTVTFSYTPSETGTYDVSVSGVSAGTLEVTEDEQSDDSDDSDDGSDQTTSTTTPGSDTGPGGNDGTGGSLIALLVLVLLGGAGGGLYYFRDEVEEFLEPYLGK